MGTRHEKGARVRVRDDSGAVEWRGFVGIVAERHTPEEGFPYEASVNIGGVNVAMSDTELERVERCVCTACRREVYAPDHHNYCSCGGLLEVGV
jgi:hypothetical protein